MTVPTFDSEASTAGHDASRRVAWAKYYQAMEDNKALLRHNTTLMRHIARLALAIERSEVAGLDPELDLAAYRALASLQLRARGQACIDLERARFEGYDQGKSES